jgi:hypothetical protein
MKAGIKVAKSEREAIASEIIALSGNKLQRGEAKAGWIPLKYESGPNSVAVVVSKSRVSFLIRAKQTVDQARAEGFDPEPVDPTGVVGKDKYKYRFLGLRLENLQKHEALFTEIVKASVETIISRRPKAK